ncbi:uncharacterized protein PG998_009233 [Apiospora kogelbergensis]|uniref:uncharacterized protein n=1 Tax=Apiospora kogelbergensis TaxID=1337665 RepID=UPI00312FF18B
MDFFTTLMIQLVYNCRSDNICQTKNEDDILMSVTSFPYIPLTRGIMYGCTDAIMDDVLLYLRLLKDQAFHPLMLPMVFVEVERRRLIDSLRGEMSILNQRLLDIKGRLSSPPAPPEDLPEKDEATDKMLEKDCEAAQLWSKVSELKNGVQSLTIILESISTHSRSFLPDTEADLSHSARLRYTHNTEKFQARLEEIMIELKSEVEKCDSVLGGMSLATQMEWNYHSRRDAKANIIIAHASKRDSSQMRYISLLGMVFLPGTFLATLFSMSFFNWIPDGSPQVISPWIGLYCGSAAMLTLLTLWRWKRYVADQERNAGNAIKKALESDTDSFGSNV